MTFVAMTPGRYNPRTKRWRLMEVKIDSVEWTVADRKALDKIAETLTLAAKTEDRVSRECMLITQAEALQRLIHKLFSRQH